MLPLPLILEVPPHKFRGNNLKQTMIGSFQIFPKSRSLSHECYITWAVETIPLNKEQRIHNLKAYAIQLTTKETEEEQVWSLFVTDPVEL
jgi:hypothetical protein